MDAPPPRAPAGSSAGGGPALDGFASKLDGLAASFLTDRPDFDQLHHVLDELGRVAAVVPGSVAKDPKTGSLTGLFAVLGSVVTARFELSGCACRLSFDWGEGTSIVPPFLTRDVALNFDVDEGRLTRPGTTVQFHPDTRMDPSEILQSNEERRVGWSATHGEKGSSLRPLTMSRGPERGQWRIGQAQKLGAVEEPGVLPPSAHETWYRLLRPLAK